MKTYKICYAALKNYTQRAIHAVPPNMMSHELLVLAVEKYRFCLGKLPNHLITLELCILAVSNSCFALKHVPEDLKTYEVCMCSVRNYGNSIEYVPEHHKTAELCLCAINSEKIGSYFEVLKFIPEHMKTSEICEISVKKNNTMIRYVPENIKSYEMYEVTIKNKGYNLKYVPDHAKTHDLCLLAVKNYSYNPYSTDPCILEYVPENLRSDIIINEVLKYDKRAIQYTKLEERQMPEEAYDTLEMGYDEDSAIKDGELMVDFHDEFTYGRYYRKATFDKFILPSYKNLITNVMIKEHTIYKAKVE
jgi:hypothetical protein